MTLSQREKKDLQELIEATKRLLERMDRAIQSADEFLKHKDVTLTSDKEKSYGECNEDIRLQ